MLEGKVTSPSLKVDNYNLIPTWAGAGSGVFSNVFIELMTRALQPVLFLCLHHARQRHAPSRFVIALPHDASQR
ncbi:protein of unknown function (plasmid) [Caballeronia sp. S22]